MTTITVGSTKGGPGKSTIAVNLAVAAVLAGKRTVLLDVDPQGSAIKFFKKRVADDFKAKAHPEENIKDIVDAIRDQFDVAIIDVGGFDGRLLRAAALATDMMVIPVTPSQFDIWAAKDVAEIVALVNRAESRRARPLKARMLVNQVVLHTKISRSALDALQQVAKDIPVLSTVLQSRVAYKESIAHGLGVIEYEPDGKAAQEIHALYAELIALCEGGK